MMRSLRRATDGRIIVLAGALLAALSGCSRPDDAPPAPLSAAVAGSCPSWTAYPLDHHSNAESPYLGCVNALNLQNMVADPHDLEQGRTLGSANGEHETLAVEAYQRGRIPPFKDINAPRPTISLPNLTGGGTSP
jgi:type IV pilus biogenesis protein CpaD/CtpE